MPRSLPRTVPLLALLLLSLAAQPAAADFCGGPTATLHGALADTLGVTVTFGKTTGWTMRIRAYPGAPEREVALPLPTDDAHYVVHVAPKRSAVAIVQVTALAQPPAASPMAWVYTPDGQLAAQWTHGQVLTSAELAAASGSISHVSWHSAMRPTTSGATFVAKGSGRSVVLDTAAHAIR